MKRLLSLLVLFVPGLWAQTFYGRIAGTISDSTGGMIPRAAITVKSLDTNIERKVNSDNSGTYDAPLLSAGTYQVTVTAAGMQSEVRRGIRLEVNQTVTIDFTLPVASSVTAVEVVGDLPLLQAETSGVGATLETRTVENFPLIQRDIMGLVRALPGVIAAGGVGDARGGRNVFDSTFSVAGGRNSTNEVLLDGAANTVGDFNGVAIIPPQDSVQEFRIETSSYSAEFGRTGGGTVNVTTKAGTNTYHGSAYYYHQNDALNANSFTNNRFGTARQHLRRHQYGYSAGGPVQLLPIGSRKLYDGKNKTFFFASFEGRRESDPLANVTSIPTALELQGDFSQTKFIGANGGQLITIFNPFSTHLLNGINTRDPFPGNVIPANLLNPIAVAVLKLYPSPNRMGSSVTGRQNYQYSGQKTYARDLQSYRVDQFIGSKQRLFLRYSQQEGNDKSPAGLVNFTNPLTLDDTFQNIALDDTLQVSTHLSNVFRYSFARFHAKQLPVAGTGYDPTTLGLPSYIAGASNLPIFPNFNFGGDYANYSGTNIGSYAYNNQPRDTQGIQDQMVLVHGRQNIKMGAEYRLYRFYPFQVFSPTGTYSFGQSFTQQNPLDSATASQGFGLASFLLGTGNFTFEHAEPLSTYHHYAGAFVQDDWKIRPTLTINLGLRWETETGTAESHDRLTYFDPNAANPLSAANAGPRGAVVFTGHGNPRSIRATNFKNFEPRVGMAWRFAPKFVARAAYGIYFLPVSLEPGLVTTPFGYTISADTLNADYTPKTTLSNPFPGGIPKPNTSKPVLDGSYRLGSNVNTVLRDQPPPYMQEWNVAVERQFSGNTVLSATYYGSRGVHLPIPSMELNQIDPKNLAQGGNYLTGLVQNPFAGFFTSGLLARPTIPREQLLKPYPQFANPNSADAFGGSLLYSRPPVGDSIYHATTIKVERRFSQGFSLTAHYTLSKLLDTGGTGNGAAFTDPSALRDTYNIRLERSLSSFDVTHRAIVTYGYDLPFGRGKKYLNQGGVLDRVVGGWSLFSFHTFQNGLPVAIGGPDLSRIAGASPSRASIVAGIDPSYPASTENANARAYNPQCGCTLPWINPAAFTTTPQFVIPNGPRFLPNVRSGFVRNWDMTANKAFAIRDRLKFTLTAQFFNLLNQVTFAGPGVTTVNSANFGSAGGVSSNTRVIEVGGKIVF